MRPLLPLLTGIVLLAGCSNRERLNPLDPQNPLTGGAPAGFAALADNGSVRLTWATPAKTTIFGVRILRRVGAAGSFEPLADLPPDVDSYRDAGLQNGLDHAYRAQFLLVDGGVGPAAEDIATPGRARPWVTDYSARALFRITPDARHVAETVSGPFFAPTDLDVDRSAGRVWLCDPLDGSLWTVTHGAGGPVSIGSLIEPVAVAVDPNGQAWVCDDTRGAVQKFDIASSAPIVDVRGLATPLAVAVDVADNSAWVCERTGDLVRHIGSSGAALPSAPVVEPSRVAVDSVTHNIWVTSFNRRQVVVASSSGAPLDTIGGFAGPIGIAIDPQAGRIWVADADGSRLIVLGRSGAELFRVNGLPSPREVSIDRASGEAWVTLPAAGQVVRIGPTGTVIRALTGLSQPVDVAVEIGP